MKISNRAMAGWAITVFIVVGGVLLLIGVLLGDESDRQDQPTDQAPSGSVSPAPGPVDVEVAA